MNSAWKRVVLKSRSPLAIPARSRGASFPGGRRDRRLPALRIWKHRKQVKSYDEPADASPRVLFFGARKSRQAHEAFFFR
jgi:hypothetical protein